MRERRTSIGHYIAMAGAVGWMVVVPTVAGALIGRWLDQRYDTGILFSGALIVIGLVLGCYGAWTTILRKDESE